MKQIENEVPKYYVYALRDEQDRIVYIGKGCRHRALLSAEQYKGTTPVIIERHSCEREAYAREKIWITRLAPKYNTRPGGGFTNQDRPEWLELPSQIGRWDGEHKIAFTVPQKAAYAAAGVVRSFLGYLGDDPCHERAEMAERRITELITEAHKK